MRRFQSKVCESDSSSLSHFAFLFYHFRHPACSGETLSILFYFNSCWIHSTSLKYQFNYNFLFICRIQKSFPEHYSLLFITGSSSLWIQIRSIRPSYRRQQRTIRISHRWYCKRTILLDWTRWYNSCCKIHCWWPQRFQRYCWKTRTRCSPTNCCCSTNCCYSWLWLRIPLGPNWHTPNLPHRHCFHFVAISTLLIPLLISFKIKSCYRIFVCICYCHWINTYKA